MCVIYIPNVDWLADWSLLSMMGSDWLQGQKATMKILGHCFERQHLAAQNDDISMILDGFDLLLFWVKSSETVIICNYYIPISAFAANLEPYIGIVFDDRIWAVSSCNPVGWGISIGWLCVFLYIDVYSHFETKRHIIVLLSRLASGVLTLLKIRWLTRSRIEGFSDLMNQLTSKLLNQEDHLC